MKTLKTLLMALVAVAFCAEVNAQTIWTEDFDGSNTTNAPTLIGECTDETGDYFGIVGSADINVTYGGAIGNFLSAQDTDGIVADAVSGCMAGSAAVSADFTGIDVSSCGAELYLCFDIADAPAADGANDWDVSSSIVVSVDGASVANFAGTGTNSVGVANGDATSSCTVGGAFTTYCSAVTIPADGTADINIAINGMDAGDEDVAVDNITFICGVANLPAGNTDFADCGPSACDLTLVEGTATCDANTTGTDTYTAIFTFTDADGLGTYTVTASNGTPDMTTVVDMASGTVTVTGATEGMDVVLTFDDGADCIAVIATVPTPTCAPPPASCVPIVITEVMYDPCSGMAGTNDCMGGAGTYWDDEANGEWVEIYNYGTMPLDVSGYLIGDNAVSDVYEIPAGTVIQPGDYLVIGQEDIATCMAAAGINAVVGCDPGNCPTPQGGNRFNNTGDDVEFTAPDGTVCDIITYDAADCSGVNDGYTYSLIADPATFVDGTENDLPTAYGVSLNGGNVATFGGGSPGVINSLGSCVTNLMESVTATCNGTDAVFDISFDYTEGNVTDYDIYVDGTLNTTLSGYPTGDQTAQTGTITIPNSNTATSITIEIRPTGADANICFEETITVDIPACTDACPDITDGTLSATVGGVAATDICSGDAVTVCVDVDLTNDPTAVVEFSNDGGATWVDGTPDVVAPPVQTISVNIVNAGVPYDVTPAGPYYVGDVVNYQASGTHPMEITDPSSAMVVSGVTANGSFTVTMAGSYTFDCLNAGHPAMFNTLVFEERPQATQFCMDFIEINTACDPVAVEYQAQFNVATLTDVTCDLDNQTMDAAGAVVSVNVYPIPTAPMITIDDAVCNYTITPACPGDILTPSTAGPAIPGEDPAAFDVMVSNAGGCMATFSVDPPACPSTVCGITDISAAAPVCSADGLTYTVTVTVTGTDANNTVTLDDAGSTEMSQAATGTVIFTYADDASYNITVTDTDAECIFPAITGGPIDCTVTMVACGACTEGSAGLVITELSYDPSGTQGTDANCEYIELFNSYSNTITLDANTTLALSNGASFTFPAGTTIAPGEYIIIAINPTGFGTCAWATPPPAGTQIFGPTTGSLANAGESVDITLACASNPAVDFTQSVAFSDGTTPTAGGGGDAVYYPLDGTGPVASAPTPGSGDCVACAATEFACTSSCPMVTTPLATTEDLCDGGMPALDATTLILDDATLATQDANGLVVTWYTDAALTTAFNGTVAHSGADNCVTEDVILYAAIECIATPVPLIAAGQTTITVYPSYDVTLVDMVTSADCTVPTVASSCGNYTITPDPANPAAPASGMMATFNYTIEYNNGPNATSCFTETFSVMVNCPAPNCPVVTTPLATTEDVCDGGMPALDDTALMVDDETLATPAGAGITVSWWTDAALTTAFGGTVDYAMAGGDGCNTVDVTLYASIECAADNTVSAAGETVITIYPPYDATTLTITNADCTVATVVSSCANYTITPDPANPAAPAPGMMATFNFTIEYNGGPAGVSCFSQVEMVNVNCPAAGCPSVAPVDATDAVCDGALAGEIATWQGSVEADATNTAAIADGNTDAAVIYSTDAPAGVSEATPPTAGTATGVHSGADLCAAETQMTFAYLLCFGDDGVAGGGDDSYLALGMHTLTVYPTVQPTAEATDAMACTTTLTPGCASDTFGAGTNATGGAVAANWDAAMGVYTAAPGEAAGTLDVMVSSDIAGSTCPPIMVTITTTGCAATPGCTLVLSPETVTCDAETAGTDTYTVSIPFDNGTEGFPGGMNYTITTSGTLGGDNPMVVQSGTITITFTEGSPYDYSIQGTMGNPNELCDFMISGVSPTCEPVVCQDEIAGMVIGDPSCDLSGITVTITDDMGVVVTTLTTNSMGVYDSSPAVYPCGNYFAELTAGIPVCYGDGETAPKSFIIDGDDDNTDTDGPNFGTIANIPTVGEWGLIMLALLMSIVAVAGIKQRNIMIVKE